MLQFHWLAFFTKGLIIFPSLYAKGRQAQGSTLIR